MRCIPLIAGLATGIFLVASPLFAQDKCGDILQFGIWEGWDISGQTQATTQFTEWFASQTKRGRVNAMSGNGSVAINGAPYSFGGSSMNSRESLNEINRGTSWSHETHAFIDSVFSRASTTIASEWSKCMEQERGGVRVSAVRKSNGVYEIAASYRQPGTGGSPSMVRVQGIRIYPRSRGVSCDNGLDGKSLNASKQTMGCTNLSNQLHTVTLQVGTGGSASSHQVDLEPRVVIPPIACQEKAWIGDEDGVVLCGIRIVNVDRDRRTGRVVFRAPNLDARTFPLGPGGSCTLRFASRTYLVREIQYDSTPGRAEVDVREVSGVSTAGACLVDHQRQRGEKSGGTYHGAWFGSAQVHATVVGYGARGKPARQGLRG